MHTIAALGVNDPSRNFQQSWLVSSFRNVATEKFCFLSAGDVPRSKRATGNTKHRQVRLRIANGNQIRRRQTNEREQRAQTLSLISLLTDDGGVESGVMCLKPIQF